jgi:hypothetical protein
MKGKYTVLIRNNVLQYRFEIRRNITIVQGNSATGKTTLVEMIREYYENGEQSGIFLQCEKECVVLDGRQWKAILRNIHDSIVFIDEGNAFVTSDEFASELKQSDNYFVIVTRERLENLPYSVDEIYGIKSSGKYGTLQQTYQEFYHIYGDTDYNTSFQPEVVIVEDSNAGFEFFTEIAKDNDFEAISAGGKSKVHKLMRECEGKKVLVIADGAAFGSEMERVMKKLNSSEKMAVYLPESFEWLILKSDVINDKEVKNILNNPSEYIESSEYMSWERYFTALLVEKTSNTYLKYSKSRLNEAYKNKRVQNQVLQEIPDKLMIF